MRSALFALLLAALLGLGACGSPRPPGGFGRLDVREGVPDRLVLEGSPYEMGWWQGHLLRDRILKLRNAGVEALLRRMGFRLDMPGGVMPSVRQHLDLCVDQTLHRLSERLLQELEGMAAATGLESEELIRLDVARDALRMKGMEAGLPGAAGIGRTDAGYEARILWGGADAHFLVEHALVIHRKPVDEAETVSLSWPGSVGAVAAASSKGGGYVLAEVEMRDKRRLGFGSGRPFHLAAREALYTSPDAEDLLAATTATMGHLFLGFIATPDKLPPVQALAGVGAFTGSPDPIYALADDAFMGLGPYEDAKSPNVKAVWEAVVRPADLGLEDRFLRLREHALRGEAVDGPEVHIRWTPGATTFSFRRTSDGQPREVTLRD